MQSKSAFTVVAGLLLAFTSARALTLASADIKPGSVITAQQIYLTCGGANLSPQLSWTGVPIGARSLALTMIDLDVKPAFWSHWVVVGLPPTDGRLIRGVGVLPGGAKALRSDFGDAAYGGPCPPMGSGIHHYQFTLWALATKSLFVGPGVTAAVLMDRLSRASLARATFTGAVSR